jgi:dTDP-4-amino-4,6-dideoxygalactose transaminase
MIGAVDELVPFQRPQFPATQLIENYFRLAREAHWFSNEGPCVRLLQERVQDLVGGERTCVAVSSGTLGLMVALRAAAEPSCPRRHVLVPSFTYIASVSAIVWSGLEPVFVDVARDHWHLDPDALQGALDARGDDVAAVLACSTFGCAPPVRVREVWEAACASAGVPLVVDSAAGFGSRDEDGAPLGRQGAVEVFSFHATKPLAAGEGGAVLVESGRLAELVAEQTRFGLGRDRQLAGNPGLNAKMSELHAAAALAGLDELEAVLTARSWRARAICDGLHERGFEMQSGRESAAWQFVPLLAPTAAARNRVLDAARAAAVQVRTYHEPLHEMPPLDGYERVGDLAVTRELASRSLSLPLANDLSDEEIERVREVLSAAG